MPRRNSLPPAEIVSLNKPFYYNVNIDWPEAGVVGGFKYLVQPGPTFHKDIIIVLFESRSYLCRLIKRDDAGNLHVYNHANRQCTLKRGTYFIEGRLILDNRRPTTSGKIKVSPSAFIDSDPENPERTVYVPNERNYVAWYVHSNPALTQLDPRWEINTRQPLKDVLNLGWLQVVHPEDREKAVRVHKESQSQNIPYTSAYRVMTTDGKYMKYLLMATPIFNHLGEVLRWEGIGHFIDIL